VRRILAAVSPGEVRIATMHGDEIDAYAIWRPGAPDGLGDIYMGQVTARVPAMAGAFVALADAEGFLPDSDGAAGLSEGGAVLVRLTRSAQGGKGPRLAIEPAEAGTRHPAGLVKRGPSPLHRAASAYPGAAIEVDDAALLATLRPDFGERLRLVARAFNETLEAEIDTLASPWMNLPGGLRASIVPTPALVAIDMDGGASTALRTPKATAQFAANRAALPALARAIRLRNLSGAILIDLAGLAVKRRTALGPELEAALANDPARPRLLGFTHLGLAEIFRPRSSPPLYELLAGPHAAGLAGLREAAGQSAHRRPAMRAAPEVVAALQADPVALTAFARQSVFPLTLRSDPSLPRCSWVIEDAANA
jgi:Ribonuclease G/E